MLEAISHAVVYVADQDSAKTFYTEKLGLEVRVDASYAGFRWLTVGPRSQPDVQLVLMAIAPGPMMDDESARALRTLVERGVLGGGVLLTADVRKTYEELKAKGVEFVSEPAERPYGLEAVFRDDSGNYFSLGQRR